MISLSSIADDPRVRRHCEALEDDGWDVRVLGYSGGLATDFLWLSKTVERPQPTLGWRLANAMRLGVVRLLPFLADAIYWTASDRRLLYELGRQMGNVDLYIANDWNSLPLAFRLARENSASVVYDSHEFALMEFSENWRWRMAYSPTIRAIEGKYIRKVRGVSTVSLSIAQMLVKTYGLSAGPCVVRNVPSYEKMPLNIPDNNFSVLFHGVLAPGRGLEPMIDSVKFWRPEFHLTIRGMGPVDYIEALKGRIEAQGVADRVRIVPPVPITQLTREANNSDIGIHCLPDSSEENHFALPNKIFEYIMAGLALCVSDLPEMSEVVRVNGIGKVIPGNNPQTIADTVNKFTYKNVIEFKKSALKAAEILNWDHENKVLLDMCHKAIMESDC